MDQQNKHDRNSAPNSSARADLPEWTGFDGKTLWDLLSLLTIPVMLVLLGILFTITQNREQQQIEDERSRSATRIEEKRAQETALQGYLDQMGILMLEHDLGDKQEFGDVHSVARARTLTSLQELDGDRKASVLQFSRDSGLLRPKVVGVVLRDADFSDAQLLGSELSGADFYETDFSRANLSYANLEETRLERANLAGAQLFSTKLKGANLTDSVLFKANLSNADLRDVNLQDAFLAKANLRGAMVTDEQLSTCGSLEGATMPDGSTHE